MTGLLVSGGFAVARIGGVVATMPALGVRDVPVLVKVLLSVLLAGVVLPGLPAVSEPPTVMALLWGMCTEVVVGTAIGSTVRMVFGALPLASELLSNQMGHNAANLFDPLMSVSQSPLGLLSSLLASLVFLGSNLHLAVLLAVSDSFVALPPGSAIDAFCLGAWWADLAGMVLSCGLRLAAPIVVLVFLINTFVAVIARLAPSMNVFFSMGLLLTLSGGCLVYYVSLPVMIDATIHLVGEGVSSLPGLVELLAARRSG